MLRRLLLVLQSISLIPPIVTFIFWLINFLKHYPFEETYRYSVHDSEEHFLIFLLSFIPFILLILGKYIVYGKFYIFKNEEGEENKLRDSSRKDDSENRNQDSYEPPFPDGF